MVQDSIFGSRQWSRRGGEEDEREDIANAGHDYLLHRGEPPPPKLKIRHLPCPPLKIGKNPSMPLTFNPFPSVPLKNALPYVLPIVYFDSLYVISVTSIS